MIVTIVAGCLLMAVAGALYARLLGRAANDVRGGWLFGMAFGFALWAAGAVFILPLVGNGELPAGPPATGVFLSLFFGAASSERSCPSSIAGCISAWTSRESPKSWGLRLPRSAH